MRVLTTFFLSLNTNNRIDMQIRELKSCPNTSFIRVRNACFIHVKVSPRIYNATQYGPHSASSSYPFTKKKI